MKFTDYDPTTENVKNEGEIYKIISAFGKTFELRYGYYDESDKKNPLCKPVVIYPDFIKAPFYTDDGLPFVTVIQDACEGYEGNMKYTDDTTCAECKYFKHGDDWLGVCMCPHKRKTK